MKKSLYFVLAAAAAFASCTDESYNDWAQATDLVNPQGSIDECTVKVTPNTVVLEENSPETVNLFTLTPSAGKITSATMTIEALYAIDTDANGTIPTDSLTKYVTSLYGKAPVQSDVNVAVKSVVTVNGTPYATEQNFTVPVTPWAPAISEGYALYLDGKKVADFDHSETDVYDDPAFSTTVVIDEDDVDWYIMDKEGNKVGPQLTSTSTSGTLVIGDAAANGNIETAGKYKFVLDMWNRTYTISQIKYEQYVYFIGATDGWQASDQRLNLEDGDKGVYRGYIYVADPNNWGIAGKFQRVQGSWDGQLNGGNLTTKEGCEGDDNLIFPAEAVYYIEINISEASIKATKIENMNLVGDFNGWNVADAAQTMTWNATDRCFEITGTSVNTNGWKFAANNAWAINLGGRKDGTDLLELTSGGNDLKVAGTTVKLYPTRSTSDNIYCTVE